MHWRTAYFRQALSDYEVFLALQKLPDIALCHRLHYLQMATEKMAKGFLTPPGAGPYDFTHKAFRAFVPVALANKRIRARLGMSDQYEACRLFLNNTIKPLAEAVQNLSPEGDPHPNPEYPWLDTTGRVISPLDYSFQNLTPRANPEMQKLLYFVEACLDVARDDITATRQA